MGWRVPIRALSSTMLYIATYFDWEERSSAKNRRFKRSHVFASEVFVLVVRMHNLELLVPYFLLAFE